MIRRSWRDDAVDLAVIAALIVIGASAFATVFTGSGYLVAVTLGLLGGLVVAGASRALRMRTLPTTAVAVVVMLLLAAPATRQDSALATIIPTPQSITDFCVAVIRSWKHLLTVNPPVHAQAGLLTVPYLTVLLAAILGGVAVTRLQWPSVPAGRAFALVPASIPLLVAIAFGTRQTLYPVVLGAAFLVVAVGWLSARRGRAITIAGGSRAPRLAFAGLILVVSAACGAAVAPAITGTNRELLRDHVVPPLETNEFVTPLASFREYLKEFRGTNLMKVTGLAPGDRVRLAAMDRYDGRVFNVAASGVRDSDSGAFGRFDQRDVSASAGALALPQGRPVHITIENLEYDGVWIPTPGAVSAVNFTGSRTHALDEGLFYNPSSGTTMSTAGLTRADVVELTATTGVHPTDGDLTNAQFAPLSMPAPELVPQEVVQLANKLAATETTPLGRARALEAYLHREGFYSNGLGGQVRSRAGHNADRIAVLLSGDQMVGDDEQYSVAMALMAQSLGMPARVVMGFQMPKDRDTITGDDVRAWVEIAFDHVGWVSFDPTPPKDRVPQQEAPKPKTSSDPLVAEPPQPPQDRIDLTITTDPSGANDDNSWLWLLRGLLNMLVVTGQALALLVVTSLPFVAVAASKWQRRRTRRALGDPSARVAAGWQEILDTATDLGVRTGTGSTRREAAFATSQRYPTSELGQLAHTADAMVFGPGAPQPEDASRYWTEVDSQLGALRASVKSSAWWRGVFSVRSLLGRARRPIRPRIAALVKRPTASRTWVR